MQEFQEQMDAELTRIPFFSQISDEAFINMTPSLNIAFNKELEKDQEKLDLAFDVLECMISKEGQTLIADGKGVISLNVDVPNMMEDVPGLEDEINNNSVYIRYSAQKSFDASLEAVHGLLSGEMDETQLMKESGIARTFNQLFFIISSLLTFFHFLLYLSKIITKDN